MADIADLLRRSRAAHQNFHMVNLWTGKEWMKGDQQIARRAILDARALRQQAHDADPDHVDPEWLGDKAPHDKLMAFYNSYLGRHG